MSKATFLTLFERLFTSLSFILALWATNYNQAFLYAAGIVGFSGYAILFYSLRSKSYVLEVFGGYGVVLALAGIGIWSGVDFETLWVHFNRDFFREFGAFAAGPVVAGAFFLVLFAFGLACETGSGLTQRYEAADKSVSTIMFNWRIRILAVIGVGAFAYLIWLGLS